MYVHDGERSGKIPTFRMLFTEKKKEKEEEEEKVNLPARRGKVIHTHQLVQGFETGEEKFFIDIFIYIFFF